MYEMCINNDLTLLLVSIHLPSFLLKKKNYFFIIEYQKWIGGFTIRIVYFNPDYGLVQLMLSTILKHA